MMRVKGYCLVVISASFALAGIGCGRKEAAAKPDKNTTAPQQTFTVKGSVREMTLTPGTVEFPEHAGKQEFTSYCGICHSLKYISQQPDFPRKTWEAEVNKMVVKYKAPIDSVNCKKIVEYLIAIKSNGQ